MTNEEIIKSIHPDFYNKRAHVRRRVLLGFEVEEAMDAARKDEAISFSKFLSGFIECQAGWLKKFEHPDDKEKFYTIEQVYEMFKEEK